MKAMFKNLVMMVVILIATSFNSVMSQVDTLVKFNIGNQNDSTIWCNANYVFDISDYELNDIVITYGNNHSYIKLSQYHGNMHVRYNENILINNIDTSYVKIYKSCNGSLMIHNHNDGIHIYNESNNPIYISSLLITYNTNHSTITPIRKKSKLINVFDMMNNEVDVNNLKNNQIYIYRCDDGSVEKKIILN
jgi:hypothetical protein